MKHRVGGRPTRACAAIVGAAAQLIVAVCCSNAAAQSGTPTIEFSAPASGATYSSLATIPIQVSVTDPTGTIAKVEFRANDFRGPGYYYPGALIGVDSSPPYSATWSGVTASTHKITAIGQTAGGTYVTGASTTVLVTGNPNIRPTVRILEPVQNSVAVSNSSVTFKVEAFDTDGSIDCVRFNAITFMGPDYLGEDCTAPFRFTWSPGNGTYEVQAQAIDNVGHANSKTVEFAIGNHQPMVSITSPADGALLTPGQSFVVKADASDPDGTITKVEFWDQVGGTRYGTDTAAPYEQPLTAPQQDGLNVIAIAYDNHGATRVSNRVRLGLVTYPPLNVELTTPYDGASFAAQSTIPVAATANDPGNRILSMEFIAQTTEQTIIIGADTTPPYSVNWTAVPAGTYGIAARAYTALSGSVAEYTSLQARVTVFAQNSPPAVALTSPADGGIYTEPADVMLRATASDTDGSIARVEFHIDHGLLATDLEPPYEISWNEVKASEWPYVIQAVAYDNQGARTTSISRRITVHPAPQPPQVALTAPVDGQIFFTPATIDLSAAAADFDGAIDRVEFYSSGQLLGIDSTSPYSFRWNEVPVGTYALSVRAIDNSGMSTQASPVTVTVRVPDVSVIPDAPVVSLNSELPTHDPTVGATPGEAGANVGEATYTIPIAIPPGRAGMQPKLSLAYGSRGGGLAGAGWSISGGSSITRCSKTFDQDGLSSPVKFLSSDALCLDGLRLIEQMSSGKGAREFRTEIDTFARVREYFDASGASCFKVEHKSGEIQHFGAVVGSNGLCSASSANARVVPSGAPAPVAWLLEKREDRVGNNVLYSYTNFGFGENLPASIVYTGLNGQSGNRRVDLSYAPRPVSLASGISDVDSTYLTGALSRRTQRLTHIRTYVGSAQAREYRLEYGVPSASSGRSLLRSVQECAFEGATAHCRRPTLVGWQEAATAYQFKRHTVDLPTPAPLAVELREGASLTPAEALAGLPANPLTGSPADILASHMIGDVDGDGSRESLISIRNTSGGFDNYLASFSADRQTIGAPRLLDIPHYGEISVALYGNLGDANNDGRTDLIGVRTLSTTPVVRKEIVISTLATTSGPISGASFQHTNTGVLAQTSTSNVPSFSSQQLTDMNADGKAEGRPPR